MKVDVACFVAAGESLYRDSPPAASCPRIFQSIVVCQEPARSPSVHLASSTGSCRASLVYKDRFSRIDARFTSSKENHKPRMEGRGYPPAGSIGKPPCTTLPETDRTVARNGDWRRRRRLKNGEGMTSHGYGVVVFGVNGPDRRVAAATMSNHWEIA